jgi:hypothetical protein
MGLARNLIVVALATGCSGEAGERGPAGETGGIGMTGERGPAGPGMVWKDANNATIENAAVVYDAPLTDRSNFFQMVVFDSNGNAWRVDPYSGLVYFGAQTIVTAYYSLASCTGTLAISLEDLPLPRVTFFFSDGATDGNRTVDGLAGAVFNYQSARPPGVSCVNSTGTLNDAVTLAQLDAQPVLQPPTLTGHPPPFHPAYSN